MPMTAEPLTDEWRLPGGAARVPVAKTDPADPALWLPLTVHLADTACVPPGSIRRIWAHI